MSLPPDTLPERTVRLVRPVFRAMRRLHDYSVEGLEHVPQHGPALVVFNHSLATYDILLFGASVYLATGRLINSLADRAIFSTPGLAHAARKFGAVQGEPHTARALLDAGRLVGVAPGGMREALRSSNHKYQLEWSTRFGFAKLAIATQAPVLLAACPAADDIFDVVGNPVTNLIYDRFRLPFPIVRGVHAPKLTHFVSEPILPPKAGVEAFQALLVQRMQALMQRHSSH